MDQFDEEFIEVKAPSPKNVQFVKRFKQAASEKLLSKSLQEEIKTIRNYWGVPKNGFTSLDKDQFIAWLKKQKKNKFLRVNRIFNTTKLVKTRPEVFLGKILECVNDKHSVDDYPDSLYFMDNEASFDAYLHEQPFAGIVHYILFNEIFEVETNQLQLTISSYGYPVLRFGPNATMNDIREMLPLVNFIQKEKKEEYKKGCSRYKKNFEKGKFLVEKKLKGYDAMDELGESNLEDTTKDETRKLARLRQTKKRVKDKMR